MVSLTRRTWAEIDLDAIEHNYKEIESRINSDICPVVKADAYGHGAVALTRLYEKLGAKFFGVSNIDEALQLRNNGIETPILIFGYTPPTDVKLLNKLNISQCLYSTEYAQSLINECKKANIKIKVHIKIDTGMSRLGFYFQDSDRDFAVIDEIKSICKSEYFICEGIFTHFASADEGVDDFTLKQFNNFKIAVDKLKDLNFSVIHCANSGATLDFSHTHFDMVRAGVILYGLEPSGDMRCKFNLKPALALKSVVSNVKIVKKGSTISYGRTYTAETDIKIATVPIGYADGYTRVLAENGSEVLIGGKRCKIVGRICMDQLMVKVDDNLDVHVGDIVTLIGKDKDEEITCDEIAKIRKTINYEVICDLGARVPRVYYQNNKLVETLNYILK